MTIAHKFIKKLQNATGNEILPQKFWEDYLSNTSAPTFQDVLNKYADYCRNLPLEQQKEMSNIFWKHVKDFGTPIIEKTENSQSKVYFLFPREKLSNSEEKPDTKKELYLQGDFHGYGSTLKETQELTQLPDTDIMYRSNTMTKDAQITYYYVQLEPKYGNKTAIHFYGDIAYKPPSFFPVELSETSHNKPAAKTEKELAFASELFWGSGCGLIMMSALPTKEDLENVKSNQYIITNNELFYFNWIDNDLKKLDFLEDKSFEVLLKELKFTENHPATKEELAIIRSYTGHTHGSNSVLIDEFSKYHKSYGDSFFVADPKKGVSHLNLPINANDDPEFLEKFFSEIEKKATHNLVSKKDKIYSATPENVRDCSRLIHVFAPLSNEDIDQVVIINDGRYYQLGNTAVRLNKLLSENSVIIFITPQPGLEKEAIDNGVEFEPSDSLPGMGYRSVDYKYRHDAYADFIHYELLPELVKGYGIKIPNDPSKRTLVGASLSGTFSIYMGMAYPERVSKVVAQSPSINNRRILEEKITKGEKPSCEIFLSCGQFESPEYAKNLNVPFAEELASHLGIKLHLYPHGHQMEGWSPQLENALPAIGLQLKPSQDSDEHNKTSTPVLPTKNLEIIPEIGQCATVIIPRVESVDLEQKLSSPTELSEQKKTETTCLTVGREITQYHKKTIKNYKDSEAEVSELSTGKTFQ
jgi:hypothetical protein